MTELKWSEETTEAPRKKRRFPAWLLWGCGCGCLALLLVGGILSVLGVRVWNRAHDPEVVWAHVEELLPYETRPEGWEAVGISFDMLDFGQYVLNPPEEPFFLMVQRMPSPAELEPLLDPDSRQNRGIFGVNKIRQPESGTIEVQGREVRCMRYLSWLPEDAQEKGAGGASLRIDLTSERGPPILLQITALDDRARIEDADVARLLEPFEVWRER
jgi:hypothetical protein